MTVHWNSHKGFATDTNKTTSADISALAEEAGVSVAELLWAMRKTPEARASQVNRAKKLMSEPGYPSEEVLRKVAEMLARDIRRQDPP